MADTFELKIVTPEHTVFSGDAVSITVPGSVGYFGVLAHHAPMVAEVGIGELKVRKSDGSEDSFAVCGGFVEVRPETTIVLADTAEEREQIDLERAEQAAYRARERLSAGEPELDVPRAEAALARALNRLHVAARR